VKEGIFEGTYSDPKELYEVKNNNPSDIEKVKAKINKKLPRGKHAVRGRGKHRGKLVVRNKRMSQKEMSAYTSKMASKAVLNNIEKLSNMENSDDIEAQLEKLILSEMMREQPRASKRKPRRTVNETQYEISQVNQSSSDDDCRDGEYYDESSSDDDWAYGHSKNL
jgi:hypothetical protein